MTRFYIVRHGETVANKSNQIAGHYESPLTELGKKQAMLTGEALKDVAFDAAYCSPLSRARETAGIILNGRMTATVCPDVIEMYLGKWEGMDLDELDRKYPQDRATWHHDFGNSRPTGGESAVEAYNRMARAYTKLAKENEGKTVLVVSHGGVIQCLRCWAKGIPANEMSKDGMPGNAAITVVDVENGVPTLVQEPDNSHLGEAATVLPKNI